MPLTLKYTKLRQRGNVLLKNIQILYREGKNRETYPNTAGLLTRFSNVFVLCAGVAGVAGVNGVNVAEKRLGINEHHVDLS